jgi:flagellum-specific peptidoglycan hydrolase FlgJ
MSNNKTNHVELKVVAKQGQSIDVISKDNNGNNGGFADMSFTEILAQILRGLNRLKVDLHHKLDKISYGIFSRFGGMTLLKICILAIIMFWILGVDVAFISKTLNFVSEKEKTYTNKHRKGNESATSASFGAGINDLSPASPDELSETQVRSYIERFSQTAISEMDKYGIPASISMAQAIVESRSGTSTLAVRNNNHFGIKCFSKSCAKGHCSNFTDDHHKDFFRKYTGPWESWREHSNFLMKHRYHTLLKYGKNYKAWAKGLREYGYATDESYDKKLIAIIERYNLQELDDL